MVIKKEDVKYYRLEEEVVCPECITDKELEGITADEVFSDDPFDDSMIFCDRCKKRI